MIPVLLPSTELQMAVKALLVGIPVAILIHYGRRTHDERIKSVCSEKEAIIDGAS